MFKLLVVLACAAGCLTAMSAVALADEFILWPSEDAWVNEESPEANYGGNTYLTVRDRSGLAEAFMRFSDADLARLSGVDITAAALCLYQYQGTYSPGDVINLHQVNGGWSESTVAWQNKPGYSQAALSSAALTAGDGWREWSGLESQVAAWRDGPAGSWYGLALENGADAQEGELYARFYSSEYSDQSLRPYLRVSGNPVTTPVPVSVALFGIGSSLLGVKKLLGR